MKLIGFLLKEEGCPLTQQTTHLFHQFKRFIVVLTSPALGRGLPLRCVHSLAARQLIRFIDFINPLIN